MTRRTLYSKAYGRLNIVRTIIHAPLHRLLRKNAVRFLETRRQLAVFAFDYIAEQINLNGAYEIKDLETFIEWARREDSIFAGVLLDVGANIGNHSLFFSDYFRKVVSFEPHPRTFRVLQLNAELVSNVVCHNVGISSAKGTAQLRATPGNIGAAQIARSAREDDIQISLTTLDAAFPLDERVTAIKIDVEGHECDVLRGGESLIRRHQPMVLFEQHEGDFKDGESEAIRLLRSYGYKSFATIQNYPRVRPGANSTLGKAYAVLTRLIVGETMQVVLEERVPLGFYHFVVAIPEWSRGGVGVSPP